MDFVYNDSMQNTQFEEYASNTAKIGAMLNNATATTMPLIPETRILTQPIRAPKTKYNEYKKRQIAQFAADGYVTQREQPTPFGQKNDNGGKGGNKQNFYENNNG